WRPFRKRAVQHQRVPVLNPAIPHLQAPILNRAILRPPARTLLHQTPDEELQPLTKNAAPFGGCLELFRWFRCPAVEILSNHRDDVLPPFPLPIDGVGWRSLSCILQALVGRGIVSHSAIGGGHI